MKKFLVVVGATLLVGVPLLTYAADFRAGDQPSIKSGETINDDVYVAGGSVTSAGKINGDLLATGGSIVISGPVGGDLAAGGGNITVTSDITDDARLGGGTIVVQGAVGGDLLVGGGQIHLGGSKIGGDVVAGGGVMRLDAPVGGDVLAGGGEVFINSVVTGNVKVNADKLTLGSAAVINGSLDYSAIRELTREDGATVKGAINFKPRADGRESARKAALAFVSGWIVWKFLALLACSLVLGLLFRRYAKEITDRVNADAMRQFGAGLIAVILFPVVSGLLLATIIGIPLGIIGFLSFAAVMIFTWMLAPIALGGIVARKLWKHDSHQVNWKTISIGVVVYTLVGFVPFVGWLAQSILTLATLGAAMKLKWGMAKEWR